MRQCAITPVGSGVTYVLHIIRGAADDCSHEALVLGTGQTRLVTGMLANPRLGAANGRTIVASQVIGRCHILITIGAAGTTLRTRRMLHMSGMVINEAKLQLLRSIPSSNELGILLGAGASMASGLPDWNTLVMRVLQATGAVPDARTAQDFLARQDPILAIEAAKVASSDWTRDLRAALYPQGDDYLPSALHLAAATLAAKRLRSGQQTTAFTLNFDQLLENALLAAYEDLELDAEVYVRTEANRRLGHSGVEVQHLHGLLGPLNSQPAENVVLSLSDFNELGATANPWQVAALQEAITRGPLIVAGTSYRDTDIRQWLHNILRQLAPDQPVFALVAREGLGLSRGQFEAVSDAIQNQWKTIGVQALLLEDYSDAAQILWELPEMDQEGYQPPAERISLFWQRVCANFSTLQNEHAALLAEDLQLLNDLGQRSTLTLWLADDKRQLVRWASYDRVYRTLDTLKRVPLAHDSHWIAARAAARNSPELSPPSPRAASRWPSIVAAPVLVELPGGPTLPVGAVSAACDVRLPDKVLDEWEARVQDVAEDWSVRLSSM